MSGTRIPVQLPLAVAAIVPGAWLGASDYLGLPHPELPPPLAAAVFGLAIVGAALLLSWAGEAAQVDISAGLALAVLALLAVLPEYAVDMVFGVQAGQAYEQAGACVPGPDGSSPCSLALANMTGANRVLVGLGWPIVVLTAALAVRRDRRRDPDEDSGGGTAGGRRPKASEVRLAPALSAEVVFLGVVTLYSLTLALRSSLTLIDSVVLVGVFVAYALRLAQAPPEDPDLTGVSEYVGRKEMRPRRSWVIGLFALAAVGILATAEHFAESLVTTGHELGVDTFVLVQWVAPLASESPELIVACLFAWRLKGGNALGALLSSKVNQWSLLVGTIPLVFAIAAGTFDGLPLDTHQRLELLITAAQSLLAVSLLVGLRLGTRGALLLLALFGVQFAASLTLPREVDQVVIAVMSGVYLVMAVTVLVLRREQVVRVVRDGLRTPFRELEQVG
jgi:cation:H+ antiporter